MKRLWVWIFAAALLGGCQAVGGGLVPAPAVLEAGCSSAAAKASVEATVRAFFAALAADDRAAVRRLTTADFHAFEIGRRFEGAALLQLIADARRSGRVMEWNPGPIEARADCAIAFASWENRGAVGTAGKMEPRAWLESALLVRQGPGWAIAFLHSTPQEPAD